MKLSTPNIIGMGTIAFVVALIAWNVFAVNEESVETPAVAINEAQESDANTSAPGTSYTLTEIAAHATTEDCWTAIEGSVYDLTEFISGHPGGPQILRACGVDGTVAFRNLGFTDDQAVTIREMNDLPEDLELHSPNARELLAQMKIGILESE